MPINTQRLREKKIRLLPSHYVLEHAGAADEVRAYHRRLDVVAVLLKTEKKT